MRPMYIPYHTQVGIVVSFGFLRTSVKVLLTNGEEAWYNIDSLELLNGA